MQTYIYCMIVKWSAWVCSFPLKIDYSVGRDDSWKSNCQKWLWHIYVYSLERYLSLARHRISLLYLHVIYSNITLYWTTTRFLPVPSRKNHLFSGMLMLVPMHFRSSGVNLSVRNWTSSPGSDWQCWIKCQYIVCSRWLPQEHGNINLCGQSKINLAVKFITSKC